MVLECDICCGILRCLVPTVDNFRYIDFLVIGVILYVSFFHYSEVSLLQPVLKNNEK